jgi:hypothetical protein
MREQAAQNRITSCYGSQVHVFRVIVRRAQNYLRLSARKKTTILTRPHLCQVIPQYGEVVS